MRRPANFCEAGVPSFGSPCGEVQPSIAIDAPDLDAVPPGEGHEVAEPTRPVGRRAVPQDKMLAYLTPSVRRQGTTETFSEGR